MDWTAIGVAVIAFLGTFGGSLAGIRASNKVVNLRLDMIEKKMDRHNCLMERMAKVEARLDDLSV